MFRIILAFLFLFFNMTLANDLQGKVTYTENSARIEAFKDLARHIDKKMFKDYKKDKYTKDNINYLKNKIYKVDKEPKRNINPFYILNNLALYSVEYEDDINTKYYYNILGHLQKFEINDYSGTYPYRAIAYDKKGNVINITFVVSQNESFIFDKNEELIGHWLNNQFYNKNGQKRFKRILE